MRTYTDARVKSCQKGAMHVSSNELRRAVEVEHGGTAMLVTKLPVKEVVDGKTVWEGVVHIFNLRGNTSASRAYAWATPTEGKEKRQFVAVLHLGNIRSPLDAVRAAIVAERAKS
jgi:hypothetical protein